MKKYEGNLEITKDNENDFTDLVEVTGDLYVDGSAKLEANQLQTVGGYLRVYGSAKLEALQTVGGDLYVDGSAKLEANQLQTVGGYLRVYGSAKLEALQTVGGYLRVYGSAKLEALQTVGGDLYVDGSAKLEAPNLKEKELSPERVSVIKASAIKQNKDAFERQGYLCADGILQTILNKKTINNLTVYKTKHIVKDKTSFVVFDGVNYSHGSTLEEAKESLKYKISTRDTSEFKEWKLSDEKPIEDLIKAYRSITGACEFGTKEFCQSQELKEKYTVKEVITMTSGKFGNEQFKSFFA